MGFSFRKSFKLGPVRLNVSRSGVGASVGVRGARVGVSAKGRAYGHVGAGGVGYRFSSGNGRRRAAGPPSIEQWQGVGSAGPSPTWFVSCRGETIGPVSDATLRAWAAQGAINPGTYLQSADGGPWVPFEQTGFAAAGASYTWLGVILAALGIFGFIVAALVLFSSCG